MEITALLVAARDGDAKAKNDLFPAVYKELLNISKRLEHHFRDCQDMEFTIERGRLFMLQTRNGKRTAEAAVRIAVEMAEEKLINRAIALTRVPQIDTTFATRNATSGARSACLTVPTPLTSLRPVVQRVSRGYAWICTDTCSAPSALCNRH